MLKIGVFGAGHLGKFHINNWMEINDVEIIGFYDPNDLTALEVSQKFNIKRYTDPEELIRISDAIDVVAPTTCHFEICELAIRQGKHVFVEKPLANTMDEARKLVKLAKEAGIKFQVGHVERFNPAFLAVKDMYLNPMFIEVHRLAEFNPRSAEVSVILDLMIHDIDIILSIVNSDVKSISAIGVGVVSETPDIANARIEFDNGCVANLTCSRISMKKMRKIRLFQKDSFIGIDLLDKKTEIIKLKEDSDLDVLAFDIDTASGKKSFAVANPEIPAIDAIKKELEEFRNAIIHNTRPVVSEMDGLHAMEVAHQILEKIGNNVITRNETW